MNHIIYNTLFGLSQALGQFIIVPTFIKSIMFASLNLIWGGGGGASQRYKKTNHRICYYGLALSLFR